MEQSKKLAIALGFFDGVHLGHQALLRRTVERAVEHGMTPAVFTFDRSPKAVVTGQEVPLLTTPEERICVIRALFPIETVLVAPFDREMMTMEWQAFLDMLVEKHHAGWLVAGHDFRFGHKNQGDPEKLCSYARQLGLGCDIIPAVMMDGSVISSTRIRELMLAGRQEEANRLLGHDLLK